MCRAARAEAFPAPPLTRGAHIGTWGAARRWRDGCRVDAIRPCAGIGRLRLIRGGGGTARGRAPAEPSTVDAWLRRRAHGGRHDWWRQLVRTANRTRSIAAGLGKATT